MMTLITLKDYVMMMVFRIKKKCVVCDKEISVLIDDTHLITKCKECYKNK